MSSDVKCTRCGRVLELHCCNLCGGALEAVLSPAEARLPRITERLPDGSEIELGGGANAYRPLAIKEAKEIARSHGLEQIVVWSFRTGKGQHVTTWGEPLRHSALAAEAGNHVKQAAGWPANLTGALPQSLIELFAELDAALEPQIRDTVLHKGTVLAVLAIFRDVVRARDPELAEELLPARCEAAPQTFVKP